MRRTRPHQPSLARASHRAGADIDAPPRHHRQRSRIDGFTIDHKGVRRVLSTASTMSGKRWLQSYPLRLNSRTLVS